MVRIFVSYSHQDSEYLEKGSLLGFLKGLERDGARFWVDTKISVGHDWDDEIHQQISSADIALVLVSHSFLNSDYCTKVEVRTFLKRAKNEGLLIFPVILSACHWTRESWLKSRQFLPRGGETIEEHFCDPGRRKRLFLEIFEALQYHVERIRAEQEERRLADEQGRVPAKAPERAVLGQVTSERRFLTVLHCELAPDASATSEVDPEDRIEAMEAAQRACRGLAERFEGYVGQHLSQGLLVYFGYPSARENAARQAVEAGLALVEEVEEVRRRLGRRLGTCLAARVGIQAGLVEIRGRGRNRLILGEIPRGAERLANRAAAGTVVASHVSHDLVKGFFHTEELPSGGARAWRILGRSGAQGRIEAEEKVGLTRLVGREQELGILEDRWRAAEQGRGQVALVFGDAGLGKSRLVAAFKDRMAEEIPLRPEWRCSPNHRNSAFYPMIRHLERTMRIARDDSAAEKLRKMERTLEDVGLPLPEVVPLLAELLAFPLEGRYPESAMNPQQRKRKTQEVLLAWILNLAERQPLLCVVEDLHWIDPSTLEVVTALIEQVPTCRILLLCTFRPEFEPPWGSRSFVTPINVSRLARREILAMVGAITGGKALPPEILQKLVERTDGVPLFAEELTKMVLESSFLREAEGRYELTEPLPALAIPDTLHDSLMARLDRLGPAAKRVAQVGATIGRDFSLELLQSIIEADGPSVLAELERLAEAELVYRKGFLREVRYVFKHALVQDAAYQSLVRKRRQEYHTRIAETLEERFPETASAQPELLAHHFTEAGETAKAIDYWYKAGQRSTEHSANLEAIEHLERGLELLQPQPYSAQRDQKKLLMLLALGVPLAATRGYAHPKVASVYEEARRLCYVVSIQQSSAATESLAKGLELLKAQPESRERDQQELTVRLALGMPLSAHKGYADPRVKEVYEHARELAHEVGDTEQLGSVLQGLWRFHYVQANMVQALELGQEVLSLGKQRDPRLMPAGYRTVASTSWFMGSFREALEHARAGFELYDPSRDRERGFLHLSDPGVTCGTYVALSLWHAGLPDQALETSRKVIELAREVAHPHTLAFVTTCNAWTHIYRREPEPAMALAEETIELSEKQGFDLWAAGGRFTRGWALAAEGQLEEGLMAMRRGLESWEETGANILGPYHRAQIAEVCGRLRRFDEGLELLEAAEEWADKTEERFWQAEIHRLQGELLLEKGAPEAEAEECFLKAARRARSQHGLGLGLRAATSLARLRQRQGREEEAREGLAESLGPFSEGLETADLKEAKSLLDELG